jgi:hypothetical protein
MQYYKIEISDFNVGIGLMDELNPNIIKYREIVSIISSYHDIENPFKINENTIKLPELDFFKVIYGKPPKHLNIMGGWLPRGILIKKELYFKLKEKCIFAPHICAPIKIQYRKKENSDYFYCFFFDIIEHIDFEKSVFSGYIRELDIYEEFFVKSYEELLYLSQTKYNYNDIFKKIRFKNSFKQYDIFGLFYIGHEIFFSNKVKKEFQHLGIDGVDFVNPDIQFE